MQLQAEPTRRQHQLAAHASPVDVINNAMRLSVASTFIFQAVLLYQNSLSHRCLCASAGVLACATSSVVAAAASSCRSHCSNSGNEGLLSTSGVLTCSVTGSGLTDEVRIHMAMCCWALACCQWTAAPQAAAVCADTHQLRSTALPSQ